MHAGITPRDQPPPSRWLLLWTRYVVRILLEYILVYFILQVDGFLYLSSMSWIFWVRRVGFHIFLVIPVLSDLFNLGNFFVKIIHRSDLFILEKKEVKLPVIQEVVSLGKPPEIPPEDFDDYFEDCRDKFSGI